ncbi:MAG: PLP-dependent transferase [Bacteroidota bacterium]|nr:PLP-dependent transferase [Bacteroidota bacterium]
MEHETMHAYLKDVIKNMPDDWLNLTTHRLDIYDEAQAKYQFLKEFKGLFDLGISDTKSLSSLPTAFDYIRLGHPLSCVLEWMIASSYNVPPSHVISFDSKSMPLLSILRRNALLNKKTRILYNESNHGWSLQKKILNQIYGYKFTLQSIQENGPATSFNGSTIIISNKENLSDLNINEEYDFIINFQEGFGSIILVNGKENDEYISEIQHVRRRETIAMTPANSFAIINNTINGSPIKINSSGIEKKKNKVLEEIQQITKTSGRPLVASSGLSIQYAILMGLIHQSKATLGTKKIQIIVPTNCYGGTNDQARRIATAIDGAEITDLHVDGENDMVHSIDQVLHQVAQDDAVPYIVAEIPTNPRVEVPDLLELKKVLAKKRLTRSGAKATEPVFILDQTFCPNIHFLGQGEMLSEIKAISYVSGSKFPSGGKCTAGYCVANKKAEGSMEKIALHLSIHDNEATPFQYEILAKQLPSMNERIKKAYINTRTFVNFIEKTLPEAKINFVSEELAKKGFTPSVFSLDLPAQGNTDEERELYKRNLNLKLINLMIENIPEESKHCVSYGQLKGCYWTVPATSTQGTTKEGDKDYIARVALSPKIDLERHKEVFLDFVKGL